jgi:hypothetical protein
MKSVSKRETLRTTLFDANARLARGDKTENILRMIYKRLEFVKNPPDWIKVKE